MRADLLGVLNHVASTVMKTPIQNHEIIVDLPSLWINSGTISTDILTTGYGPNQNKIEEKNVGA